MPASMINAPTGGRPNVMGKSMAMVATEPIPGRTPINVPTSAPIRQNSRFQGVAATEKPSAKWERSSFMRDSLASKARPQLERQGQQVDEQQYGEHRHHDPRDGGFDPSSFRRSRPGDHKRCKGCRDETERADRHGEDDDRYRDPEGAAHSVALERLALDQKAHGGDDDPEGEQDPSKKPRCCSRSKRKAVHALKVARRPKGKQRKGDQRQSAI